MGDVLIFAEHQGGHFPKTTLTAVHAGLELAGKRAGEKAGPRTLLLFPTVRWNA